MSQNVVFLKLSVILAAEREREIILFGGEFRILTMNVYCFVLGLDNKHVNLLKLKRSLTNKKLFISFLVIHVNT